jgi:hypothetical protein
MAYDYPVTHRPDLLECLKRVTPQDGEPATTPPATALTKEQRGMFKRENKRWEAYASGNAYMLYLLNRTTAHAFRVQAYGSTPMDAVKRWYRGIGGTETWICHCVKVVAAHACADTSTSEAGKLLMGTQQDSFPY